MTGKRVAELVNGWRTAGIHQVIFEASDLPSGVYIYHLEVDGLSKAGKLVLMK